MSAQSDKQWMNSPTVDHNLCKTFYFFYYGIANEGYCCTIMLREELVHVTFDDACFTSAKFTNDQNFEQILMTFSSSTARGLQIPAHFGTGCLASDQLNSTNTNVKVTI